MAKYKVIITEVLVGEIEIDAKNINEAIEKLKDYHEEAGRKIKPLETVELSAEILWNNKDRYVRLI